MYYILVSESNELHASAHGRAQDKPGPVRQHEQGLPEGS